MRLETVTLKRGRPPRVERGHPWVYRTEIQTLSGPASPGDTVRVATAGGRTLGYGFYNPHSMIAIRLLTRYPEGPPDRNVWRRRLEAALDRRRRTFPGSTAYRWCNAEADGLPGLVVDRFDRYLVVESLALGTEAALDPIVAALTELAEPDGVFLRGDAPVRPLEGLPVESRPLWGKTPPDRVAIDEDGIAFLVDVKGGQKTGHFFDQRENRRRAAAAARGGRVLDAFCHTGGFALAALAAGAGEAVAVDSSAAALAAAERNAHANGMAGRVRFVEANVFDHLRELARRGERYDLVVLDPPAFAKNRRALENALRGYKEVNLRAMRLVPEGGTLATASCSQPLDRAGFLDMLRDAAADSHRQVRLRELAGAAPDHPVLLAAPETDYLKFALLEMADAAPPAPLVKQAPGT
jgi:23S rRNA (cytosine1962-C5)-methyltransferase